MTMNDKPRRPGSKSFSPDRKGKPFAKRGDEKPSRGGPEKARPLKVGPAKVETGEPQTGDKAERISKVMARAGVASRRDIERMIMEGRVRLNGVVLDSPVVNVTLADKI